MNIDIKNHTVRPVLRSLLVLVAIAGGVFFISFRTINKSTKIAETDPVVLRQDFSYNGKSIHPRCLEGLVGYQGDTSDVSSIDVTSCSTNEKGGTYDESKLDYSYSVPISDNPTDGMESGEIAYKLVGQIGDMYYLNVLSNTGGSGEFSYLLQVQKTGNILTAKDVIHVGDRCNGGLADVTMTPDGTLQYGYFVSPADINLTADPKSTLKPYDDLEASAGSCFGTEEDTYNTVTHELFFKDIIIGKDASLEGNPNFDVHGDITEDADWLKMYTYQSCFNIVYNTYIDKKETTLDQVKLTQFNTDFMNQCVNKKITKSKDFSQVALDAFTQAKITKLSKECVFADTGTQTGDIVTVEIRELHNDICGGDPSTAPLITDVDVNVHTLATKVYPQTN